MIGLITGNNLFRTCLVNKEEESGEHILCDFSVLQVQYRRSEIYIMECLNVNPLMSLLRFIKLWAGFINNKMKLYSRRGIR